jgi:hypothetical protein
VKGVAIFKVGDDDQSITDAATRFLDEGVGQTSQMRNLVKEVFHGHLRSLEHPEHHRQAPSRAEREPSSGVLLGLSGFDTTQPPRRPG